MTHALGASGPTLQASIDLTWPTALVAIVLLAIAGTLMLIALKNHGTDSALKLWGGIGTFVTMILGGLLGVSVGEQQAGAKLDAAFAEHRALEDDLHAAEVAIVQARVPVEQQPETPLRYVFKALKAGEEYRMIDLTGTQDAAWAKAFDSGRWKNMVHAVAAER